MPIYGTASSPNTTYVKAHLTTGGLRTNDLFNFAIMAFVRVRVHANCAYCESHDYAYGKLLFLPGGPKKTFRTLKLYWC